MQILRGRGKVYDNRENCLSEVTYEIYHRTLNGLEIKEWRGEITPDEYLLLTGSYIIELEDGRRGTCTTVIKTTSSFGLVFDSYDIEGTGPLKL